MPVITTSIPTETTTLISTTKITTSTMTSTSVTISTTIPQTTSTTSATALSTGTATRPTTTQETTARPLPDTTTLASKEDDQGSSNKTLTIALATAIPAVFIVAAVGFVIWMKKSGSTAGGVLGRTGRRGDSSTLVEMDGLENDNVF